MCVGRLSMVLILLHMYVYGLSALTDGIPGRPHSQTVDARFRGNYSRAGWTTVDVVDGGVFAFPVAVGATAAAALRRPFSPSAVACAVQSG